MGKEWAAAAAAALACALGTAHATVPSGFSDSTFVGSGLSNLTGLEWAQDGSNRLFVLEKIGRVRVVSNGSLLSTPFATESLYTGNECGLLGIAFDPNYIVNRFVYFFITVSSSEQQIVRYTDVNNVGQNRLVIVRGLPTLGGFHDAGALGFGPDGKLYWGVGDLGNGTGVNADLSSLAAKIGRANPDGTVPADNPFFDGAGPNQDYIWARGFRNPFTLTFQPQTGALWVDVAGNRYEQIFRVGRGDHAGWNAYENNQPTGFIPPVISYRTNGTDTLNLTGGGAVRTGNVATFTTTVAHGFHPGALIAIAGVADASFNGSVYVRSVLDSIRFTADQVGPDSSSGGGTATTANLGGAVTGGTFYDANAFPTGYWDNFFFGDFNSGRLIRAQLTSTGNTITRVDSWGIGFTHSVDVAQGPDGALYSASYDGVVRRAAADPTAQRILVSKRHLRLSEGGDAAVAVSLAQQPASSVTVNADISGDPDLSVSSGNTLTFTSSNWSTLQTVVVHAGPDADSTEDVGLLTLSASGFSSVPVELKVTDSNANALLLSRTSLTINENSSGTFTVALQSQPTGDVSVQVSRTSGSSTVSASPSTLTFTPSNFAAPQTVTVSAAADANTSNESAVITVSASGFQSRFVSVTVLDAQTSNRLTPTLTVQWGTSAADIGRGLAITNDGISFVVGETAGSLAYANAGGTDAFIFQRLASGGRGWARQLRSTANDVGVAVARDGAGNLYLAGNTFGSIAAIQQGGGDVFLAKYDSVGNRLWVKQLGTGAVDSACAVVVEASGNVLLLGNTSGALTGTNQGGADFFAVRLNASGTELLRAQVGTSANETCGGAGLDGAGNVYLAGQTDQPGGYFARTLVKLSSSLALVWRTVGAATEYTRFRAVAVTSGGDAFAVGSSANAAGGATQALLERFNTSGSRLWTQQLGEASSSDEGLAVALSPTGDVVMAGFTRGALWGTNAGGADAFLSLHSASAGTLLSGDQFGTSGEDFARGVEVDSSNRRFLTGQVGGALPGQTAYGGADLFLRRY